jgi:hypothetical protein
VPYTSIEHSFWTDEAIIDLDDDASGALALFMWSMSNGPCASLTGLTEASRRKLARVPCVHDVDQALARLAAKPLVLYDDDAEVLWCVNRADYSIKSWKQAAGALKWVESFPPSPMVVMFKERYGSKLASMASS